MEYYSNNSSYKNLKNPFYKSMILNILTLRQKWNNVLMYITKHIVQKEQAYKHKLKLN